MNRAEEDYIKALWGLHQANPEKKYISNHLLEKELGHTPQTANEMIKKLKSKELLIYKPYKGTALTEDGYEIATSLIRRHRLWELFLVDILDYTWDKVHEEAEKLEHVVSPLFEEKLYYFLGSPEYCPLGYPIPALDGTFPKQANMSLSEAEQNCTYKFVRVIDDNDLLMYINKFQLKLHDTFTVENIDRFSNIITIKKNDKTINLSMKVASNIFIKELENGGK